MEDNDFSHTGLVSEMDAIKGSNLYKWLKKKLELNAANLPSIKDEIAFRWNQGHSQQLSEIIEAIDRAAEEAWSARETAKKHEQLRALRQGTF